MQPTLPLPATPQKPALPVAPAPSAAVPEQFDTTLDAATADDHSNPPPRTNDLNAAQDQPATSADGESGPGDPASNAPVAEQGNASSDESSEPMVETAVVAVVPVVQPVDLRPIQAGLNRATAGRNGQAEARPDGESVAGRQFSHARVQVDTANQSPQQLQTSPHIQDGHHRLDPGAGMHQAMAGVRDGGRATTQSMGQRASQSEQPSTNSSTSEQAQGRFRIDDVLIRNPARPAPMSDATRDILRAAGTQDTINRPGTSRPTSGGNQAATQVDRLLELAGARIAGASDRSTAPAVARADQLNASLRARQFNGNVDQRAPESIPGGQGSAMTEPAAIGSGEGRMTFQVAARGGAQQLPGVSGEPALSAERQAESPTMTGVRKGLAVLANQKGGTLTMRLDPPSLGPLRLEMAVDAGRVRVQMLAGSESARALLGSNLGMLRTALEERGLAVERLVVETTNSTTTSDSSSRGESRDQGGQDARNEGRGQAEQDASQGRSRGRRDRGEAGGRAEPGKDSPERFDQVLQDA